VILNLKIEKNRREELGEPPKEYCPTSGSRGSPKKKTPTKISPVKKGPSIRIRVQGPQKEVGEKTLRKKGNGLPPKEKLSDSGEREERK